MWTREGIVAAELLLRREAGTLFADMVKKLTDYPEWKQMLENILFSGNTYSFIGGKEQLLAYLDYYKTDTGYLVSFNFNKNKKTGIREIVLHGKRIIEVVV